MWEFLKTMNIVSNSSLYGEDIFRLSKLFHNSSKFNVADTLILSSKFFKNYIDIRYIEDKVVDNCIIQLRNLGILESDKVEVSISVCKECNMDMSPIIVNATYPNIKNAITKCYNRWFDGKSYAYRIVHRIKVDDTFPSIYIQPYFDTKTYSIITRNSINGKLINADDYNRNVNCNLEVFGEKEESVVSEVDSILALPQKVSFIYDRYTREIIIVKLTNYPMTRNAYLTCLIEKHKNLKLTDEDLLMLINPNDLISFDGYKMIAEHIYKGVGNNIGYVSGKAIFRNSKWEDVLYHNNESYIYFSSDIIPEDIKYLNFCRGAVFNKGGYISHGMTACIGLFKPAIIDYGIILDEKSNVAETPYEKIHEGDIITISSYTGEWAKNGAFEPHYKTVLNINPVDYVFEILKSISLKNNLYSYSIDFQMHYANILQALKKVGYKL